jgi:uncharacterized protein (DUF1499 family)
MKSSLISFIYGLALCSCTVQAAFGLFGQPKSTPPKTTSSTTAAVAASTKLPAGITACKPGSKNCIVTTWTAPKGTGTNVVKATLVKILNAYPQAGQANVDKGGYKIVSSNNSPIVKVEYTSGIGTFAKLFNGGQPFVDDLIAVVTSDKNNGVVTVTIKSSSRIGESDFGVNQKRLKFLGAQAKAMGWTVPEPKY